MSINISGLIYPKNVRMSVINPVEPQIKLMASDAKANDNFGRSVSLSTDGNTCIIGAAGFNTGGTDAGAAYIFTKSGNVWTEQQKLLSSDIAAGDMFGYDVCMSGNGNTCAVGAWGDSTAGAYTGAAYIFTRSGNSWVQQQKLMSNDIQSDDNFGSCLTLTPDGNTCIVGANSEDTGGSGSGTVYVFTRSGETWTQQQKIKASDATQGDNFGSSISVSKDGNTFVVGARLEDGVTSDSGSAYIFTKSGDTWTQQSKLLPGVQINAHFGESCDISDDGNTCIVGAPRQSFEATASGTAYVFTRSGETWTLQQRLFVNDPEPGDFLGISCAISSDGNTCIVGARDKNNGGTNAGAAYVFTRSGETWTLLEPLYAYDAEPNDNFGISCTISDDGKTCIVGARFEDTGGGNAGAAYIFTRK